MKILKWIAVSISSLLLLGCVVELEKSQAQRCEDEIRYQMREIEKGAHPGSFTEPIECRGLTNAELIEIMEKITRQEWED